MTQGQVYEVPLMKIDLNHSFVDSTYRHSCKRANNGIYGA